MDGCIAWAPAMAMAEWPWGDDCGFHLGLRRSKAR
uniref:Uncharacterized protein n=1 Tax=Arundo donax TaxID=35708 RepID=A0A0A9G0M6_ARUDO